jgi:hypothetical protein
LTTRTPCTAVSTTGAHPVLDGDQSTHAASDLSAGFHDYQVIWQPGMLTWAVDGVAYAQYTEAQALAAGQAWPFELGRLSDRGSRSGRRIRVGRRPERADCVPLDTDPVGQDLAVGRLPPRGQFVPIVERTRS